jgi:hypothetical protein
MSARWQRSSVRRIDFASTSSDPLDASKQNTTSAGADYPAFSFLKSTLQNFPDCLELLFALPWWHVFVFLLACDAD